MPKLAEVIRCSGSLVITTCGPERVQKSMVWPREPVVVPPLPMLIGMVRTSLPPMYTFMCLVLLSAMAIRDWPILKSMLASRAP